jgi:hypothetical protein
MERWLTNGMRVDAEMRSPLYINEGLTEHTTWVHEAYHTVAAEVLDIGVYEVSAIPGHGYKGYTSVAEFNAIVAAAPYAFGCDGTGPGPGSDQDAIAEAGHDLGWAASAARALLGSKKRQLQIQAVATELYRQNRLDGGQVSESVAEAGTIADYGTEVVYRIFSPDGRVDVVEDTIKDTNVLTAADIPMERIEATIEKS